MVINLNQNKIDTGNVNANIILIFIEGTILKHNNIFNIYNFKKYIPINNCVEKIKLWNEQGYDIQYLTSRKNKNEVNIIKNILEKNNFCGNCLHYRQKDEEYFNIAEKIMPKILIEDNCKSIGGVKQTTIYKICSEKKLMIKSILVDEFNGIDHLPNEIKELLEYNCE